MINDSKGGSMLRVMSLVLVFLTLSACGTQMQIARPDKNSGHLDGGGTYSNDVRKAEVIKSTPISLKKYDSNVFVSGGGKYAVDQVRALGYFQSVFDNESLQKIVIQNHLQDKVQSLSDPIGLNNLYRYYKPFLWIHFKSERKEGVLYWRLVVTDPDSLDDLFVCQTQFNQWTDWAINDQTMRFPLFNSLIDWIKKSSG
ncbi:MAG: hypothetical protein KGP08_08775 [Xanthomonadaceae bacterium]|nr:hypothetical protein [Xanthomonadaceae bacterium]MDE2258163.1 hypothetical protein [Xanthomonadaceae bacterium]